MSKNVFSRQELVSFYETRKEAVERDQHELKVRFFGPDGIVNIDNPDMNMLAGKIAGQLSVLVELAYFIEREPVPDSIADIDKA